MTSFTNSCPFFIEKLDQVHTGPGPGPKCLVDQDPYIFVAVLTPGAIGLRMCQDAPKHNKAAYQKVDFQNGDRQRLS